MDRIKLDFHFPVRDYGYNEATGTYGDLSGLNINSTGCQNGSGTEALELARSRHFEYLLPQLGWTPDLSSDIGRIERQNLIIDALAQKAESTSNPLTLRAFISSAFKNTAVDPDMSLGLMFDLANKYHAFSTSSLATYTIPTSPASGASAGDVETVDEPQAQQMVTQFLGSAPLPLKTPPLDRYGEPEVVNAAPPTTPSSAAGAQSGVPTTRANSAPTNDQVTPAQYDPTPC